MDLFFMFGARLPGTVLFKRNAEEIISIDYSNIEDKILDYSYDCLKCIQKKNAAWWKCICIVTRHIVYVIPAKHFYSTSHVSCEM